MFNETVLQGIALSIWTLVMEEMSGIYVELAFLDASLNFGQSLIVFAVFGLDPKCVIRPLVKRWRCLLYGAAELKLPAWEELGFETKHVCEQFAAHHLQKCRHDIATDRRLVSCSRVSTEVMLPNFYLMMLQKKVSSISVEGLNLLTI
jgi:hypothetical protein